MKMSFGCEGCRVVVEGSVITLDFRNRIKAVSILGAFCAAAGYGIWTLLKA